MTINSIPASAIVAVTPSVLGAGGSPLSLNTVMLTADPSIPIGAVQPFANLAAVAAQFGGAAAETICAGVYFGGFLGCDVIPGTLYFTQFNTAAVGAYVRGGSVAGMTLAQLQALTGTLIVTVNGEIVTSSSINLSAATSFSNAATLMTTALDTSGDIFSGTGSIALTTLTVSAVATGALHIGDVVVGSGVTAGTTITAFLTGLGGTGTYTVSASQTASSTALTVTSGATVTYDSQRAAFKIASPTTGALSTIGYVSGTLASSLFMTQGSGAVLSQGAAIAVPATLMNSIVSVTQNWVAFMCVTEPVLNTKLAFAAWVQTQHDRWAFVVSDSDVTATQANATGSFGYLVDKVANDDGVITCYDNSGQSVIAAFVCSCIGSIDFTETNGRITFAGKGQAGISPQITDQITANNLIANGYNFYAQYATANQAFQFFQNGQISGQWTWIDPYINQIYLNSEFQLALMELIANTKSIPYNQDGYNLIRAACLDPIQQAIIFGSIQGGVTLSAAQAQEVNTAAGVKIDGVLSTEGWYLQVLDPGAQVRGTRGSPACTFWYTDGGSVQTINIASIDIE